MTEELFSRYSADQPIKFKPMILCPKCGIVIGDFEGDHRRHSMICVNRPTQYKTVSRPIGVPDPNANYDGKRVIIYDTWKS